MTKKEKIELMKSKLGALILFKARLISKETFDLIKGLKGDEPKEEFDAIMLRFNQEILEAQNGRRF